MSISNKEHNEILDEVLRYVPNGMDHLKAVDALAAIVKKSSLTCPDKRDEPVQFTDRRDDPPTNGEYFKGYRRSEEMIDHEKRIAALEGELAALKVWAADHSLIRDGMVRPPAPTEPLDEIDTTWLPRNPRRPRHLLGGKPSVDLDALEDRLIAAFVKDGYDIDGEACDTVRKVFRASRAAAKEASRENL